MEEQVRIKHPQPNDLLLIFRAIVLLEQSLGFPLSAQVGTSNSRWMTPKD
jgi:hypothetical protein